MFLLEVYEKYGNAGRRGVLNILSILEMLYWKNEKAYMKNGEYRKEGNCLELQRGQVG